MDELLSQLKRDFPSLSFVPSDTFCWSPAKQHIFFIPDGKQPHGEWSLLHELSHALLGHLTYESDFELLQLEVAAWHKASELAGKYNLKIEETHIQKCLNTYRDWLHQRSTCPTCGNKSLQTDARHYQCFNCQSRWQVTASRFCRPYRLLHASDNKDKPLVAKPQTAFLEEL